MDTSELYEAIVACHNEDMSRLEIAQELGLSASVIDEFMRREKCSRCDLGLPPRVGVEYRHAPRIARMSEAEIAELYAGRRYDEMHIPSTGKVMIMPRVPGNTLSASSMDF